MKIAFAEVEVPDPDVGPDHTEGLIGDLSDPESRVSQLAHSCRGYRLLEELGTRPRVVYLKEADA